MAWGGTDEDAAIKAIHQAIDEGINLIDTAPVYGFGASEEIVGRAVEDRRDKVILATKCGLAWHTKEGTHNFDWGDKSVYCCLKPHSVRYEVEQSLRRLRTDHIDLYQTHWPDATTPIEDTMQALLDLKAEGKIRAIGVSNVSVALLDSYREMGEVASDQEHYNMLARRIEADLLPYCRDAGIAVLAYSPLAQGLLTGKVGPDREFPEDDLRHDAPLFSRESRVRVARMLDEIRPIAEARGMTLAQLAISWTIAQPGLTHALVGARNPRQAKENAQAGDVALSTDEIDAIAKAVARYEAHTPE
jgi:aryl-alcohol dehydrogenase-like predicted oxidoreductase